MGYLTGSSCSPLPKKGITGKLFGGWRSEAKRKERTIKLENFLRGVMKEHGERIKGRRRKRLGGGGFEGGPMEMVADVLIKRFLQEGRGGGGEDDWGN